MLSPRGPVQQVLPCWQLHGPLADQKPGAASAQPARSLQPTSVVDVEVPWANGAAEPGLQSGPFALARACVATCLRVTARRPQL